MDAVTFADPLIVERVSNAVGALQRSGINFLALDFDLTICGVHTGGVWQDTPLALASLCRPIFYHLIRSAMDRGLHVAIVTFSPQTFVIRDVLDLLFGRPTSALIPIRGGDRSWTYVGMGSQEGKQPHMASAVEELLHINAASPPVITRGTTIIIDDDANNIKIALQEGVRAIWLNPKNRDKVLTDIVHLLDEAR